MTSVLIDELSRMFERLTPNERMEITNQLRAYMSTKETTKRIVVSFMHHDRDITRNEPWQEESQ